MGNNLGKWSVDIPLSQFHDDCMLNLFLALNIVSDIWFSCPNRLETPTLGHDHDSLEPQLRGKGQEGGGRILHPFHHYSAADNIFFSAPVQQQAGYPAMSLIASLVWAAISEQSTRDGFGVCCSRPTEKERWTAVNLWARNNPPWNPPCVNMIEMNRSWAAGGWGV